MDTTVVNVALDTLAHDFGASITSVQWVATAYLLALAAMIPLAAWASDRFGGQAGVDRVRRPLPRRLDPRRRRLVARKLDLLPHPSGTRGRHDPAGRHDSDEPRRGTGSDGSRDGHPRRAATARTGARPAHRRHPRRARRLALDLLRQRPDRRAGHIARRLALAARGRQAAYALRRSGLPAHLARNRGVDLRPDGNRARRRPDAPGPYADPGRRRARRSLRPPRAPEQDGDRPQPLSQARVHCRRRHDVLPRHGPLRSAVPAASLLPGAPAEPRRSTPACC